MQHLPSATHPTLLPCLECCWPPAQARFGGEGRPSLVSNGPYTSKQQRNCSQWSPYTQTEVQKHKAPTRTGTAWVRDSSQLCQTCKNISGGHHQGQWTCLGSPATGLSGRVFVSYERGSSVLALR